MRLASGTLINYLIYYIDMLIFCICVVAGRGSAAVSSWALHSLAAGVHTHTAVYVTAGIHRADIDDRRSGYSFLRRCPGCVPVWQPNACEGVHINCSACVCGHVHSSLRTRVCTLTAVHVCVWACAHQLAACTALHSLLRWLCPRGSPPSCALRNLRTQKRVHTEHRRVHTESTSEVSVH